MRRSRCRPHCGNLKLSNKTGGRASFKKHLPCPSDRKQQNKEPVVLWLPNVYCVVVND